MNCPGHPYQQLAPPYASPDQYSRVWAQVFKGGWGNGPRAVTLERTIARKLDVPPEWVVATVSPTTAMEAACRFLIPDLDVVRMSALTSPTMYAGAVNAGLDVEFVDVDQEGWPVGPVAVAQCLWGRAHLSPAGGAPPGAGKVRILEAASRFAAPEAPDLLQRGVSVVYSFAPDAECPCPAGGALVSSALAQSGVRAWLGSGSGLLPDVLAVWAREAIRRYKRAYAKRQTVLEHYVKWLGGCVVTRPGHASGAHGVLRLSDPGTAKVVRRALDDGRIQHDRLRPIPSPDELPGAAALAACAVEVPVHSEMNPTSDVRRIARRIIQA